MDETIHTTNGRHEHGRDETVTDAREDSFDLVAEEFAERCRSGEPPSIAEFEAKYPRHNAKIREFLPTVALMEQLKRGTKGGLGLEPPRPLPERMGEFRIIGELGRGGMGVVYEAVQESLGRRVAVKVIHHIHLDVKRLQRFRREALAVARLHHTNIVPIFAVGEHEGLPYYAMQCIRGGGLDSLVDTWRESGNPGEDARWRFIARIGVQAAEGLHHAHEQGILHRDVKPANLLIDENDTIKITDFGLAKLTGVEEMTASGDVIGTLRYLAPEALHGESDHRSDIYSLGLTLYEMITLTQPFGEASQSELLRQVSQGEPIRPRKLLPEIPRDLETVILKAAAREPGDRYATALELATDLRRYLEDRPVLARRASLPERAWRWGRRNRLVAALTATAAASLVLATALGWIGYARAKKALATETRLRQESDDATARALELVELSRGIFDEFFYKVASQTTVMPPPPGAASRIAHGAPGGFGGDGLPPRGGPSEGRDRGDGPPPMPPEGFGGGPMAQGRGTMVADTALLQSVLSFYERFAERNATDPALQSEAAWAYVKVASLSERFGKNEEAADALTRAITMLEGIVARYPDDADYRFKLVETYIMADPWTAAAADLPTLDQRLTRACEVADALTVGWPDEWKYAQDQILAHAKRGTTLQRLGEFVAAEKSYRRAIDCASRLAARADRGVRRGFEGMRPRLDLISIREALASLLIERGRQAEARATLVALLADMKVLASASELNRPGEDFGGVRGERFAALAELFTKVGDTARASEVLARASELSARAAESRTRTNRPRGGPGGFGGPSNFDRGGPGRGPGSERRPPPDEPE